MPRNDEQPSANRELRILRRADVEKKTGLKRVFIYKLMSEAKFPASVQLGIRAVGWDAAEIDQWISERSRKRQ